MSYHDTIEEDLDRAASIIAHGKMTHEDFTHSNLPSEIRERIIKDSGYIVGADNYAAAKILESLVQEVHRLRCTDHREPNTEIQNPGHAVAWLRILERNAMSVSNKALAERCRETIRVILALAHLT